MQRPVVMTSRVSGRISFTTDMETVAFFWERRIERIGFLKEGRVIELTRSIYRGDAYDFVAELRLPEGAA